MDPNGITSPDRQTSASDLEPQDLTCLCGESSSKAKLFIYQHWTWKNLQPASTVDHQESSYIININHLSLIQVLTLITRKGRVQT
jgi:hypothetical protein